MTSSTISVNFNDTADKTVFTATEKCILKLSAQNQNDADNTARFKLNNTEIGTYSSYDGTFDYNINSRSLANLLSPYLYVIDGRIYSTVLILYLEKGDTIYATRIKNNAFTGTFYSAVFTF